MRHRTHKILTPLLLSALVLNPIASATLYASEQTPPSFADLVRNTKETRSVLFGSSEIAEAEIFFPKRDTLARTKLETAFRIFADSMNSTDANRAPPACEPLVLVRLKNEMTRTGLPTDANAFKSALIILREMGLIDDLTLMPLLASYPAFTSLGYDEDQWTKKDSEGRTATLECPTNQYLQLTSALKREFGRKFKRRHIRERIKAITEEKNTKETQRFLPVQVAWFKALEESRHELNTKFALTAVLEKVAGAKNSSARSDPGDTPSAVMSKRKKKSGGLSNRIALYTKYNSLQINTLVQHYEHFLDRMDILTADASIVIHYNDGREDETYPLTEQEQYRMAAKMLHKELSELRNSGNFNGSAPTFDDVILACVETGFIHAKELDAAMSVEDVWNPKVSGWTKVMRVVKKYGTTALILVPTPYTFWASLAITLAETIIKNKTQSPGNADDLGTSIF